MDNYLSTSARFKVITRALEGKKNVPPGLSNSCKSQGGLAALNLPHEGITPMSLNTLKNCANATIEDGGWAKLDHLRRAYLNIAETGTKKLTRSKLAFQKDILKLRATELENALDMERRYRIRLQVAYEELLTKVRSLAKSDQDLANYVNRHATGFSLKRLSIYKDGDSEP